MYHFFSSQIPNLHKLFHFVPSTKILRLNSRLNDKFYSNFGGAFISLKRDWKDVLQCVKKFLWRCSFCYKNIKKISYFIWFTIEIQNCHHAKLVSSLKRNFSKISKLCEKKFEKYHPVRSVAAVSCVKVYAWGWLPHSPMHKSNSSNLNFSWRPSKSVLLFGRCQQPRMRPPRHQEVTTEAAGTLTTAVGCKISIQFSPRSLQIWLL